MLSLKYNLAPLEKPLKVLAMIIFCLSVPVALWEGYRLLPQTSGPVPKISYPELVTIVLSGITIVLGVLALLVAALAIWGYQGIKLEANNAAERAVEKAVGAALKSELDETVLGAKIDARISDKIDNAIATNLKQYEQRLLSYASAFPQQNPESTQTSASAKLAEEYPDGKGRDEDPR